MPAEFLANPDPDLIPVAWDIAKSLILAAVAYLSAIYGRQIEKMRAEMAARIDRLDERVEGLRQIIDTQMAQFEKRLDDLVEDYRDFKRDVQRNFLRRQ